MVDVGVVPANEDMKWKPNVVAATHKSSCRAVLWPWKAGENIWRGEPFSVREMEWERPGCGLGPAQFPKGGGPYGQSATSKSEFGRVKFNTNLLN